MLPLRQTAGQLVRKVVYYSGCSRFLYRLCPQPRILMLHGVDDRDLPARAFRAQLAFLVRHFHIVPLEEVWENCTDHRHGLPKVALTFDDGLQNNLTVAYPILQDFQVPATYFVCPGLIESGRWLWNHECRARLQSISHGQRQLFGKDCGVDSGEVEAILAKLKSMPHADRVHAEQELRERSHGFVPNEEQHRRYDLMTWDELKSLDPKLITIGGHSTNHEILTGLQPDHLEREVADCRSWLERELHRPVRHFCYPNGAFNTSVLDCVARHFDSAVTTEEGWVTSPLSPWRLPRIPIAGNVTDLAWRMHHPTG